MMRRYK